MTENYFISLERVVPGPIEAVFDAWLDPSMLKQWMASAPGKSVPVAEVDPVVGGRFTIVMRSGDNETSHDGVYQMIDRPNQLAFTWNSKYAGTDTLVTINFTKLSEKSTKVALRHERFATDDAAQKHNGGWNPILDSLVRVMEAR